MRSTGALISIASITGTRRNSEEIDRSAWARAIVSSGSPAAPGPPIATSFAATSSVHGVSPILPIVTGRPSASLRRGGSCHISSAGSASQATTISTSSAAAVHPSRLNQIISGPSGIAPGWPTCTRRPGRLLKCASGRVCTRRGLVQARREASYRIVRPSVATTERALSRANPKGRCLPGRSAALQPLRGRAARAAVRALQPIPQRHRRGPEAHFNSLLSQLSAAASRSPSGSAARTSSLKPASAKSFSQRSGVISGKSLPNRMRSFSSVFAYCTSCGGKYFGLQPDRSIQMFGLCIASEIASSCHGHDGWATTICMSGKAIATSSSSIGFEFCRRRPPPQRMPAADARVAAVEDRPAACARRSPRRSARPSGRPARSPAPSGGT